MKDNLNLNPIRNKTLYFWTLANPNGIEFNELNNKVHIENLVRIYKALDGDETDDENDDSENTVIKMINDKKGLQTLRSRTIKSINKQLKNHTSDLNEVNDIMKQISYLVGTEKLLKIPIDRNAVAVDDAVKIPGRTNAINKLLNTTFKLY